MTTYKSVKYNISGADLTGIPTSAITSGTFADARISESSVTAHVTATDLQPIKSDISALALREATNESSAAFNLPNQFIDTFTDDTNLGTQTTVDRTSGYVASIYSVTDTNTKLYMNWDSGTTTMEGGDSDSYTAVLGGSGGALNTANKKFGASSLYLPDGAYLTLTPASGDIFGDPYGSEFTVEFWMKMTARTYYGAMLTKASHNYNNYDFRMFFDNASGTTQALNTSTEWGTNVNAECSSSALSDTSAWNHYAWTRDVNTCRVYVNGVQVCSFATAGDGNLEDEYPTIRLSQSQVGSSVSKWNGYWDDLRFSSTCRYPDGTSFTPHTTAHGTGIDTASATGTLIQSANAVGSAKTKVGGTMLYKDNAGTNTLGTDLKIYFTCDGGSNWTEATSYSAITPVYSTGIKQVRLGETTCTSGTDVRYKAVWANQASGSKEAQLHGIGLNY